MYKTKHKAPISGICLVIFMSLPWENWILINSIRKLRKNHGKNNMITQSFLVYTQSCSFLVTGDLPLLLNSKSTCESNTMFFSWLEPHLCWFDPSLIAQIPAFRKMNKNATMLFLSTTPIGVLLKNSLVCQRNCLSTPVYIGWHRFVSTLYFQYLIFR